MPARLLLSDRSAQARPRDSDDAAPRTGVVQAHAAAFVAEHGMNPAFLRSLYELIITETCRLEDEIIGAPPTAA